MTLHSPADVSTTATVPGHRGSVGPFPSEYQRPHVYARDVRSNAGLCVCGGPLVDVDARHTEAAPGVPLPTKPAAPVPSPALQARIDAAAITVADAARHLRWALAALDTLVTRSSLTPDPDQETTPR